MIRYASRMAGVFMFVALFSFVSTGSVYAQYSEPEDPGPPPNNNVPLDIDGTQAVGELGVGTVGEVCIVPIELDASKFNENIGFDIPYVPGWMERELYGSFKKVGDNTDPLYNSVQDSVNDIRGEEYCIDGSIPSTTDPIEVKNGNCVCQPAPNFAAADLCSAIEDGGEKSECQKCSSVGVWTAIGCIQYEFQTFITQIFLKMSVGFGGLVALGCIIYSAMSLQASRGNPETIQKARERITSCIIGLILIIFSVIILEVIGIGLLGISL